MVNVEKTCLLFSGKNAAVAGAFTGDHNVIINSDDEDDIRGVRARVRAGIQHFSFDDMQKKVCLCIFL